MSYVGNFTEVIVGSPATPLAVLSTTLTDAQIKALPTTAIQLVPAPGSNKIIRVLQVAIHFNNTAGVYTNLNATYAALQVVYHADTSWLVTPIVRDTSLTTPIAQLANMLGGSTNGVFALPVFTQAIDFGASSGAVDYVLGQGVGASLANTAVDISMDNNGSGNLTGGNAANTMVVTVYYAVEQL